MSEVYAWPEGTVSLYTGTGGTSAVVSYAQSISVELNYGYLNTVSPNGTYRDHLTGKRVTVSIGAMYAYDKTWVRLAESATAIHMKVYENSVNGSAGFFLYSGRIDSFRQQGNDNQTFSYTLDYHANAWSAF